MARCAAIDKHDYSGLLVERTTHKAGMIKLATGNDPIAKHQEKIFHAVVNAHLTIGAPILTHTNFGKQALEQALSFDKLGGDLNHVVLSHVDQSIDIDYNRRVLETGVRVEYDSAFRWKTDVPNQTFILRVKLVPEFPDQSTMGMDMAKNAYWKSYGGHPGLNYLINTFPDFLNSRGLPEYFRKIFIDNPKALFSFF